MKPQTEALNKIYTAKMCTDANDFDYAIARVREVEEVHGWTPALYRRYNSLIKGREKLLLKAGNKPIDIPKFITEKGPYYLHKKYGLSKASLSLWQHKPENWTPSPLIRLAFERIAEIEMGKQDTV